MRVSAQQGLAGEVATPLLAVGVFEDEPFLPQDASAIDHALGGVLGQLRTDKELTGRQNELTIIHTLGKLPALRIAIVGLGKHADFKIDCIRQASAVVAKRARELRVPNFATVLLGRDQLDAEPIASALVEGTLLALYRYEQYKTPSEETLADPDEMTVVAPSQGDVEAAKRGILRGEALARGTNLSRDLSNGPPNLVTPIYLANEAKALAQKFGFSCEVFDVPELERRKMGALLAVGQGSIHPPCLIVMRYEGKSGSGQTFAAVGKGITFDSGGLDIKPGDSMLQMKHDMSGAASVIGFMQAVAELKLPVNVLGLAAAAENLPGSKAYRPSDILTASNGRTIEVISTDAEGRLVLSDALAYAVEQKANAIVDLATLTGACIIALGTVASGIMGNNADLLHLTEQAGESSGERVWALPLWKQYGDQVKSEVADIKNTGGRWAGAITAGYFLSEFVGDVPWVHADIAGTAYTAGDQPYVPKDRPYLPSGATGVGVRLLVDLVERWAR